jgi:type IV pilus assembly protein PilX
MPFTPAPIDAPLVTPLHQRGFVLVTALIFLMVLSLLGITAVRGSLFEERGAANDRDIALARWNAELALRDAERDILGLRFDRQYCATAPCTTLRPAGTRPTNATDAITFWSARNDAILDPTTPVARADGGRTLSVPNQGVYNGASIVACGMPVWSGADWHDGVTRSCAGTINAAVPTVAYGTFTDSPVAAFNPATPQAPPPPRYLIEMFTPDDVETSATSAKLFFRVTAVGFGRSTASNGARTSVTLQSIFSPL